MLSRLWLHLRVLHKWFLWSIKLEVLRCRLLVLKHLELLVALLEPLSLLLYRRKFLCLRRWHGDHGTALRAETCHHAHHRVLVLLLVALLLDFKR